MSRRNGRKLAVQGLYSWDLGGMTKDDVLTLSFPKNYSSDKEDSVDEESGAFARILLAGTIDNQQQVDELITKHLNGWELSRVNKVSLAILRMSVYSLLYMKDIPPAIVIDEAIDLSKEFDQDSFKFINGVLDNIKKEI